VSGGQVVERERMPGHSTHLIIVHPFCSAVHLYDRIADDIVDKRSRVELAKDEAERVGRGVGEEDEAVGCGRLEEVELVCGGAVRGEQLVAEVSANPLGLRSVSREGSDSPARQLLDHILQTQHHTIHQLCLLVKWQSPILCGSASTCSCPQTIDH
jgi:hypothetical protein